MTVKRNKYFEEEKKMISYRKELENYYGRPNTVFYELVPLEKPIFAGWDISVKLNTLGEKSEEKEIIEAVIKHLKLDKPRFTKNLLFIKDIRKHKHNIDIVYRSKYDCNYHVNTLSNRHINKTTYFNLPERVKSYFRIDFKYKYSTYEKPYFILNSSIKQYLELKVTKSYYNFQRIPKSDLISEHTKLSNKIQRNDLWNKVYNTGSRYRDSFQKAIKLSGKKYCNLTKEEYNMGEEGLNDDNEPILAKLSRLHDKKEFGWS